MKKATKVREPVQVYLAPPDRDRLAALAERFGLTKSEVLRRGLAALEREATDAEQHPLMRLFRIADAEEDRGPPVDYDVVLEHDRAIAEHVERQIEEREAELSAGPKRRQPHRG